MFDFQVLEEHAEMHTPHPGSARDMAARMEAAPAAAGVAETAGVTVPVRSDMPEETIPRTMTLNSANPFLLLLPQDTRRRRALITPADGPLILAELREFASATANAAAGTPNPLGAYIPQGMTQAVESRDQVWGVLPGNGASSVPVMNAPTVQATGTQTTPGAGTVITSAAGLTAGTYQIQWAVSLGGTTGAPEANNFGLNAGGTQVATSNNRTSAGSSYPQLPVTAAVPANGTVSVTAIGTATTSAIYDASLVLTQLTGLYTSCRVAVITERYAEDV